MQYQVNKKIFNTLKEAIEYQNTLQLQNRDNMFEPSKQIDTTITGSDN